MLGDPSARDYIKWVADRLGGTVDTKPTALWLEEAVAVSEYDGNATLLRMFLTSSWWMSGSDRLQLTEWAARKDRSQEPHLRS
jgi:hypothetical protein